MLASPRALSFRTEERRSLGVGRADDDVETGLSSHQGLLCGLSSGGGRILSEGRRGADRKRGQKKQGSHRRRSFRLWLSEAFNVMP